MRFITYLLSLLLFITFAICKKDYYQILGVEKTSSEKEIKSAYRQLTLKYHPDKNNDSKAHDKFIEIGEAYEVLSNKEKRKNYDTYGDPDGPGHGHGHGDGAHGFDFGEMFGQFFGGQKQRGPPKADNVQLNLNIPLKDFYTGKLLEFDVNMMNSCPSCDGTGSQDKQRHTCSKCNGQGSILVTRQLGLGMIQQMNLQCDECGGIGKVVKHKCKKCHGQGIFKGPRHYEIYLRAGQPRDSHHVLNDEGDKHPFMEPGDLIINLREEFDKSWGFRRVANNLYRTEPITLHESINGGWTRKIKFFGDEEGEDDYIILKKEKGDVIMDGDVEIVKGKGMPIITEDDDVELFGDLFIEYKVIVPGGKTNKKDISKDEL
ncbi:unnamed protein product [Candida verbasci]|uniref:DnaJ-domain-containing protein n=1 Tax=Candida verbasci TaxID=1227364 RepID=A0A9W4U0U5_9ASCO|nr:unnamed protein product [Candida verbasci]